MAGRSDVREDSTEAEPAWHERTSTVVGASVAALLAIAVAWFAISYVAKAFNDPTPTPQYFMEPSASGSGTSSSAPTTTSSETITSTSPPITTDINPGDTTPSSTDTTSTTPFNPSNLPRTRSSTTVNDDGSTSTRNRPRLNETRTLYPRP